MFCPELPVILSRTACYVTAIYLQDEIFWDAFIINLGGRFDRYENHDGKGHDETQTPTLESRYERDTFTAFSPKIALLYRITEDTSIKGSIGKAFRAPTIYDLYRTWIYGDYIYASNPDLDPESVLSYEVGLEQALFGSGLLRVTAYQSDAEDFIYSITPDLNEPKHKIKTNVGKVQIRGVEVELGYALSEAFDFSANYTYNESKIKEFDPDPSLEEKYLTDVPKHKASASIGYKNPSIINAKASVRYVGERYSDDKNTEAKNYEAYTLVDLKLSRAINKYVVLEVSVEDLFDKTYEEYYVSPGRVILGTLKMSF